MMGGDPGTLRSLSSRLDLRAVSVSEARPTLLSPNVAPLARSPTVSRTNAARWPTRVRPRSPFLSRFGNLGLNTNA